jgi:hypothetical protein
VIDQASLHAPHPLPRYAGKEDVLAIGSGGLAAAADCQK